MSEPTSKRQGHHDASSYDEEGGPGAGRGRCPRGADQPPGAAAADHADRDRDFDVFALYVDPEDAELDADRYEIGGNRAAKDLNNAAIRQSTSTGKGHPPRPDRVAHRAAGALR